MMEYQANIAQREGDSGSIPGEKLQRSLYMAASHKVVSYEHMNPVLWGTLPRELLVLALARLPVPKITRLLCQLSKEWTMNIEFNRACDEANPKMAALLSYVGHANEFLVRIVDCNKYVWLYVYRFRLTNRGNALSWFDTLGTQNVWKPMAHDGGLVCFVSTWKYTEANPLCIVVINPLTRVQHELPPLQYVYNVPPTLVHMKVNSDTKEYKVVVVGKKGRHHIVEMYDSILRQWSRAMPSWGLIFGRAYKWKILDRNCFRLRSSNPSAYDFVEGQLELLDCNLLFQSKGACVMQYALVGDRMFVLHEKLDQHDIGSRFYFITEFQSHNSAEMWVPVRTHDQCFLEEEDTPLDLHACEDVLILRKRIFSTNRLCCFLDFSTSEWHDIPEVPLEDRYDRFVSLMCRVFWNIIP